MKTILITTMFSILLGLASTAQASTWQHVGTGNHIYAYVNKNILEPGFMDKDVWVKFIDGKTGSYTIAEERVSCQNRTLKVKNGYIYDKDNDFVNSFSGSTLEDTSVVPDSLGDFVYNTACGLN